MKLHEYQAKEILAGAGVPVPQGGVACTAGDARRLAAELGGRAVVKAQVHAGGRGKGGGVKVVADADEAASVAGALLGSQLVTPQTGPEGVPVGSVLVEETIDIVRELYLAMLVDGGMGLPVVMASEAGGMNIEQVAEETPEKILREPIDPALGLMPYQSRKLAAGLGIRGDELKGFSRVVASLQRAFVDNDCSLAESFFILRTSYPSGNRVLLRGDSLLHQHRACRIRHFQRHQKVHT